MGTAGRIAKEDVRRLLGECGLFNGLAERDRAQLLERVPIRNYAAGDTVFLMGSDGDAMMVVLAGLVRISLPAPEGREVVLDIARPGEVFGEVALFDARERTADAEALTDCWLAVLERGAVFAFLERHPRAWANVVELLCSRLRNTDEHVADLALLDLPVRLAKTLLRLATGKPTTRGPPGPPIQLTQREFGGICGTSRESINKCLGSWQRRGIVRIHDGLLTIANRTALEDLAGTGATLAAFVHRL